MGLKPVAGLGLVGLLLVLGLGFRLAVVASWHAPAGDGVDYYVLSQQLQQTGRFAYEPPPAPPSFTRLPGYPLLLAYVAAAEAPLSLEAHVQKATRANAVLDLITSLLVFLAGNFELPTGLK